MSPTNCLTCKWELGPEHGGSRFCSDDCERDYNRFIVKESYGYGHRGGIRINETSAPRELARSTVNQYIRELKGWANGYADTIHDVPAEKNAGWRLITARHWINGFENVRQLHIRVSNTYNRMQAGLE